MIIDAKCDICGNKAVADSKTKDGPWAYLCQKHLDQIGYPNSKMTTYIDGRNDKKK
jgi:hypothetical protein